MKPEALKGHLDAMLLAVVAGGAGHGYAIIETLRTRSAGTFDLPEGTVYPALHRLERGGLLTSQWTEGSGRRRREYSLTAQGRRSIKIQQSEWESFANAVTAVLGSKPWSMGT